MLPITAIDSFLSKGKKEPCLVAKSYKPYADIIVSAVLPVAKERDYPNITMQDIDQFNLALAEMCRERELKFLNTAEIFKNVNKEKERLCGMWLYKYQQIFETDIEM